MIDELIKLFFGEPKPISDMLKPLSPVRTSIEAIELFKSKNKTLYKDIGSPLISFESGNYVVKDVSTCKCKFTWILGTDIVYLEICPSGMIGMFSSRLVSRNDSGCRIIDMDNPSRSLQHIEKHAVPLPEDFVKAMYSIKSIRESIFALMWNNS